ncbi:MAG: DUF1282 family protein [Pseudorhodoplanes sp.]|nr:DUF1282 family protein [Pseudorhodoplanes sp.]GIK81173.1 MAG: YIP1 family protein [Alphaproteobacteria bacterium]
MTLIERVKNIILNPDREWPVIEREPADARGLLIGYVAVLAAIPAVAGFIGTSLVGVSVSAGTFRVPFVMGLLNAAISYAFSFVLVYVVALIIDWLAPVFRAMRSFPHALKLSAYSFTPSWLAGIFLLIPGLRFLTILGLYGLYLLWTGLPPLMDAVRDRSLLYAAAVVFAALIVTVGLALIQSMIVTVP